MGNSSFNFGMKSLNLERRKVGAFTELRGICKFCTIYFYDYFFKDDV